VRWFARFSWVGAVLFGLSDLDRFLQTVGIGFNPIVVGLAGLGFPRCTALRYSELFGCGVKCPSPMPNKSVKGTRRLLAVLKFCFLSRFGGFA
jgi:hypothetical protein